MLKTGNMPFKYSKSFYYKQVTKYSDCNYIYNTMYFRWVVPYNPWLLVRYRAHMNVEVRGSIKNVIQIHYKGCGHGFCWCR